MLDNTKKEIMLNDDDFIVSKTDTKGNISYCNRIFIQIAGYREQELLGQPQSIIRHPDMPKAIFQLLWKTIQAKKEFLGFVKNSTKSGNFYWVFANITPSYSADGKIIGYYSVRRKPKRSSIDTISDIYNNMLQEEARHNNPKQAMEASGKLLSEVLQTSGKDYNEFIFDLEK